MVYGKKDSTKIFKEFFKYICVWSNINLCYQSGDSTCLILCFLRLGLMTACFVGLSSFLLLVGIYSAAVSVSNDVRIRKAIRNSIEKESELIGDIGDAELDMELRDKVFSMMDKLSRRLQEDTQVESSLTDEDIRDYTNKVIQEVIQRKVSK